jgi:hypothetical protein
LVAALSIWVGEAAALRVLISGQNSEALFALTCLGLSLGIGFVVAYLAMAAYRDLRGPVAEPAGLAGWMITSGTWLASLGALLTLVV